MQVSLDEAIAMHVTALKARFGPGAVASSKRWAAHCRTTGDLEGETVWLRVAEAAERRIKELEAGRRPYPWPHCGRSDAAVGVNPPRGG